MQKSTVHAHMRDVSLNFRPNLETAMLALGHPPEDYDVPALAADLQQAVPDADRKAPQAIIRELGNRYFECLSAYRRRGRVGVRLPHHDNLTPHTPAVARGRDLGRSFHADEWITAVNRLGDWLQGQTGESTAGYRLEDALFDLLMAHPTVKINRQTPKTLAGRLGMVELLGVLTDWYRPSSWGRWRPNENDDQDSRHTPLDLNGGHFGGRR